MAERSKRTVYRPRTSIILEVPHEFKSRHGSSALWQGFILIAKSFGRDSKPSVPCIGESHPMNVKEPTSLLAKSREKSW